MSDIQECIDSFLSHCKFEKNLSPLSLKAYAIDLKQFSAFFENTYMTRTIDTVDKNIIRSYVIDISQILKPKTRKRKIATLKSFLNYLEYEDIILINPFRKLRMHIKEGIQLPKTIDIKNIHKLFSHLYIQKNKAIEGSSNLSKFYTRDIAILELLFATGMRVSELSNLTPQSINLSKRSVLIKGKGNKERYIPIPNTEVVNILNTYYKLFKDNIIKINYFFINRLNQRFSEQSIRLMIRKYVKEIQIQQHITPHMFRHSVATLLLENGVDIRFIQNILGHSTINTTQIYAQVNEAPKRKILRLKHPRGKFSF